MHDQTKSNSLVEMTQFFPLSFLSSSSFYIVIHLVVIKTRNLFIKKIFMRNATTYHVVILRHIFAL